MRKKQTKDELCTYCVEVINWEMPYSFSVNFNKKLIEGPFWEHINLKIEGKLVYPEKFTDKNIQILILGDRRLSQVVQKPKDYHRYEPNSVGMLTLRGENREFLGSIPFDVLNGISIQLQSGKIKYLILNGSRLYQGKTEIRHMRFSKDFGSEDLM